MCLKHDKCRKYLDLVLYLETATVTAAATTMCTNNQASRLESDFPTKRRHHFGASSLVARVLSMLFAEKHVSWVPQCCTSWLYVVVEPSLPGFRDAGDRN